jgi:hypothetical protein
MQTLEWQECAMNIDGLDYISLWVEFLFAGNRKERGRVHIEIDNGSQCERLVGCIATGLRQSENPHGLQPGITHRVFVISQRVSRTDRGHYVNSGRTLLVPGSYRIRVIVALGDDAHQQEFPSAWREVIVPTAFSQ